ncbi:ABC transporter substrate-binding protein [Mariniluteicoccus endophyticus]
MTDRMSRRGALRLAAHSTAAAGLGALAARGGWLALGGDAPARAVASAGPVLDRELRLGYLPITDASALLAAHEQGFLAAHGLRSARPVLFRSWESLAQAFVVGEVDVVHLLMPFALQLRLAARTPLKVVAQGHTNGSALTVAPDITDTAQLAGRRVAIPSWWSVHSLLTQRLLAAAGLTPVVRRTPSAAGRTVELVVMAPADMVSALATGAISAYAVADPFNAVAEARGIGRVHRFLGDVWRDHPCCAVVVREDLAVNQPRAVQALVDGVLDAQAWLGGHRADAGEMLTTRSQLLPQPEPAVAKVFTREPGAYAGINRHADWHGERIGFDPFPHTSATAELVGLLRSSLVDGETGFLASLDPAAAHRELVDDRFVRAALQRGGLPVPAPRQELVSP